MNRLVIRHTYMHGVAFDNSNNRNHGFPYSVTQAGGAFAPGFEFRTPDSRVVVRPSDTLQDLIAVRAVVTFFLDPSGGLVRRYNLIEGELSFALFVQPDGSLMGTILDAAGQWNGAQSAPNLVAPGRWHQAELRHDGINECLIFLDGVQVGGSYGAPGPVRSVGPNGVAVGHWPEPPGVYTLEGYIRSIEVYKYDPVQAAKGLLDPCCIRRESLDDFADRLRAKGYTAGAARQQAMEILNFGLQLAGAVRGSDPAVSKRHALFADQALAAFLRGDAASYNEALAELAALASSRLSGAQLNALHSRMEELIKQLPLPVKDWQRLIGDLCWGETKLDPTELARDYEAALKRASGTHHPKGKEHG
jgi:hypothetical protein